MRNRIKEICSKLQSVLLGGALIIAGSSWAFSGAGADSEEAKDSKGPALHLSVDTSPLNRDGKFPASLSPVVKKVGPSVVKVFTTTKIKQQEYPQIPFLDDPLLRRFFGDQFRGERPGSGPRIPKQFGLGSGVIVTADGYILTNNHVVEGADEIKVALTDGREFNAKTVGSDPKTEIAVLKIEEKGLPYIRIADSEKIEVGDLVLAVGNPFNVGQSVTMGMVSGTGRSSMDLGLDYEDFIQTDAAINPGNSGGALVDSEGRLIGINTFIVSRTGGSLGIGFAIPSNLARNVLENLVEHGRVIRGYLGVWMQEITPALATEFDLRDQSGVLVGEVIPNSPADTAGFQPGDVITEFDGKPVRDSRHLKLQVGQTAPGAKVRAKVLREGKTKTLEIALKELPQNELTARRDRGGRSSDERLEGVIVGDLDGAARSQWRIPRNLKGALVAKVDPDSPAYEAGLREGDVIQEIERQRVESAEDAVSLTQKIENKTILLRIWSKGGSRYVVVDESKGK